MYNNVSSIILVIIYDVHNYYFNSNFYMITSFNEKRCKNIKQKECYFKTCSVNYCIKWSGY